MRKYYNNPKDYTFCYGPRKKDFIENEDLSFTVIDEDEEITIEIEFIYRRGGNLIGHQGDLKINIDDRELLEYKNCVLTGVFSYEREHQTFTFAKGETND